MCEKVHNSMANLLLPKWWWLFPMIECLCLLSRLSIFPVWRDLENSILLSKEYLWSWIQRNRKHLFQATVRLDEPVSTIQMPACVHFGLIQSIRHLENAGKQCHVRVLVSSRFVFHVYGDYHPVSVFPKKVRAPLANFHLVTHSNSIFRWKANYLCMLEFDVFLVSQIGHLWALLLEFF